MLAMEQVEVVKVRSTSVLIIVDRHIEIGLSYAKSQQENHQFWFSLCKLMRFLLAYAASINDVILV